MSIEIVLPTPPKSLAPNSRVFWRVKAESTALYREYARILGLKAKTESKGTFPLQGPVTTHITFAFNVDRKRDEDNLLASLKALFDGLVDAKVLAADDSQSLHHAPLTVVVDKTLRAPEVRVKLTTGDEV